MAGTLGTVTLWALGAGSAAAPLKAIYRVGSRKSEVSEWV
jgi:hypothetical protein